MMNVDLANLPVWKQAAMERIAHASAIHAGGRYEHEACAYALQHFGSQRWGQHGLTPQVIQHYLQNNQPNPVPDYDLAEREAPGRVGSYDDRKAWDASDIRRIHGARAAGKLILKMRHVGSLDTKTIQLPPLSVNDYRANFVRSRVSSDSSNMSDVLQVATSDFSYCPAHQAIVKGGNAYHFQAPAFNVAEQPGGGFTATPVPVMDHIQPMSHLSDFTQWTPAFNGIVNLWGAGQNLNMPPTPAGRTLSAYQHMYCNIEPLPPANAIRTRLSHLGFLHKVFLPCIGYGIFDGGAAYLADRTGLHCIIAGNWQSATSIASQPWHYDKQKNVTSAFRLTGTTIPHLPTRGPALIAAAQTETDARAANTAVPDPEERDYHFAGTNMLQGQAAHLQKDDRRQYNDPAVAGEFSRGINMQVERNGDVRAARYEPIGTGHHLAGHEYIIKMMLPAVPWATAHIINGPPGSRISGSKYIKYCDCYRPMMEPEVWWMEIMA